MCFSSFATLVFWVFYVGDSCSTLGIILNYLLLFLPPRVFFSVSFSHIFQGECVGASSCSLCQRCVQLSLSFALYYSQVALPSLHDVKGERNDSSSLEWARPRNSLFFPPPFPIFYCLSFADPLPSLPPLSKQRLHLLPLCLSRSLLRSQRCGAARH